MKALLLIDIQYDYFKGGANPLAGSDDASSCAKNILLQFRKERLPIIHIQHISNRPGSTFFLKGTKGAEIHQIVMPIEDEIVIIKHTPNSFKETNLLEYLKQKSVADIVICGMMTHMCVDSTVRAAWENDFNVVLIGDACATKDLKWNNKVIPAGVVQSAFLSALDGTFAKVIPTADFLR